MFLIIIADKDSWIRVKKSDIDLNICLNVIS